MDNNKIELTPGALVRLFPARAKRSLGQHFLTDPVILDRIVEFSNIQPGDRVIEVGPGPGTLTIKLLERLGSDGRLVVLEKDTTAVEHLHKVFPEAIEDGRLKVLCGDASKFPLDQIASDSKGPKYKAVGNLPYNVATGILFAFDDYRNYFESYGFLFQLEVARRLVAKPGSSEVGAPSYLVAARYKAAIELNLKPGAFFPRPKVRSGFIGFKILNTPLVSDKLFPIYRNLLRHAFMRRRKTLNNALSGFGGCSREQTIALISRCGIDSRLRPEVLTVDDYLNLTIAYKEALENPGI